MNSGIKVKVKGVTDDHVQAGAYALVLVEENGTKELPVIIGIAEAQAILVALENVAPTRPFTHDLFNTLFKELHVKPVHVYIYKYEDGVFYAEMMLEHGAGRKKKELVIDMRPSDAIALAVRNNCDILVNPIIMNNRDLALEEDETADTEFYDSEEYEEDEEDLDDELDEDADDEEDDEEDVLDVDEDTLLSLMDSLLDKESHTPSYDITTQSVEDLNRRMSNCIKFEDYERAQVYRDEILRRGCEPKIDDSKGYYDDPSNPIPF